MKNKLTLSIFLALILGIATGFYCNVNSTLPGVAGFVEFIPILSDIFLNLVKMIISPLVFATLVVGVAKLGDLNAVGRIGGKTLLWFLSATFVSLFLGMILVNLFQPGKMMALALPPETASTGIEKAALSVKEFIKHVFPKSIFEAMAKNEILQIIVFSLFFGIGTAAIGEKGKGVIKAMDALAEVMLKVTGFVMNFAPFAVFGAMTAVIAQQGISVLGNYGIFILEFYFGLLVLWIVLISAGAAVIKKRVFSLLKHILDPVLIAYTTSSSEAALPKTIQQLEKFGCGNKIVSFVLPLSLNLNLVLTFTSTITLPLLLTQPLI